MIAAKDDVLWNAARYIERMKNRLNELPHDCSVETYVYEHGTHYVFPESLMKIMLPVGAGLFVKLAFKAAKEYPKECKETRIDIDEKITRAIIDWREQA